MGDVVCKGCGITLEEQLDAVLEQRTSCPSCGATSRIINESIELKSTSSLYAGFKAKRAGASKYHIESINEPRSQHRSGTMAVLTRIIDRENDLYHETVTDPNTGNILHECKEPLSKHQGHGTAKFKK